MANSQRTRHSRLFPRREMLEMMTAVPAAAVLPSRLKAAELAAPSDPSATEVECCRPTYNPQDSNPYAPTNLPTLSDLVPARKWIWADLRAFDNTAVGFGASGYLEKLDFKPDAIFILLTHVDFVFLHSDISADVPLEQPFAVYGGTLPVQSWSRFQLRGLVRALHKADIKVFLSLMTLVIPETSAGFHPHAAGWFDKRPEFLTVTRDGAVLEAVNPLKRSESGQYFEDVFLKELVTTMAAFDFDGFHAADGWSHLRVPLYVADFSDDLVDQFLTHANMELPAPYRRQCKVDKGLISARARWIWNDRRIEWIGFWRRRWGGFWQKVAVDCKQAGKKLVLNQPWTRDPYEAIYRYGFDYKTLERIDVDALVVETVAGAVHIGGYLPTPDGTGVTETTQIWLEDAVSMVMCVKAYIPSVPLVFLLCVQDENEQWDTLREAPAFLEREIFSYASTFYLNDHGNLERCLDGFLVCLGVGLSCEEWRKVARTTRRAFSIPSAKGLRNSGIIAVWSDASMEKALRIDRLGSQEELKTPLHSGIEMLLHEGAPVRTIVRTANVEKSEGPLLLANLEDFSAEETRGLMEWLANERPGGSILVMGEDFAPFSFPALVLEDDAQTYKLKCGVVTASAATRQRLQEKFGKGQELAHNAPLLLPVDNPSLTYFRVTKEEPTSFMERLPYWPIQRDLISKAASVAQVLANPATASDLGRIFSISRESDGLFVMCENDTPSYLWCKVSVNRPIQRAKLLSSFPKRLTMRGSATFDIKVPPNGATVLDLEV